MRVCEDEELRARYSARYQIGHIQLPLYRYTRHEANLTNDVKIVARYRKKLAAKIAKAGKQTS